MKKSNMNKDRLKCSLAGPPGFLPFVLQAGLLQEVVYSIQVVTGKCLFLMTAHINFIYINVIFLFYIKENSCIL